MWKSLIFYGEGLTFSKEMCYPTHEVRERSEGGLLSRRDRATYCTIVFFHVSHERESMSVPVYQSLLRCTLYLRSELTISLP